MSNLPPGMVLVLAALLVAVLPARWRGLACVVAPLLSWWHMVACAPAGTVVHATWLDLQLTPIRADRLSLVWGLVFHLAALLATLYNLHHRDRCEQAMALVYAGAAIAAVFAGDLLSLFVFWELTAISSVFLVWAGGGSRAYRAGLRYLILQVLSGVLLLAAAMFQQVDQGSLAFGIVDQVGLYPDPWSQRASGLLLLAFGIKAAFPLLHMWLPDAYPEASPGGAVFLSVFTTKLAIYSLLRGFAGYEALITVGCVMATVPLVYALIEADIRRALAYCLLNQLGFMVVAVGVGSPLAVDGAAAHAVAHVLYKGLLFMATGAVLWGTGTAQASRLGGLARRMPLTFGCYLVGVAAISAPLFSGFVTKSLTLSAVAQAEHLGAWLSLLAATAGVFLVCGLRLTADVFVTGEPTPLARPLPWNMGAAMVATATCCLLIGLFPNIVYRRLPYEVSYHAYTLPHVVEQLQLMAFAGLAFVGLVKLGFYPWSVPGALWDLDWVYRRGLPVALASLRGGAIQIQRQIQPRLSRWGRRLQWWLAFQLADDGRRGRFAATGRMAMAAAVMLVIYLLLYYR